MHRMKLNSNGFDVTYGKEKNKPYSATIYPHAESGVYLHPIRHINGCATKEEILVAIGFEVCDIVKSEINPNEPFTGTAFTINYGKALTIQVEEA